MTYLDCNATTPVEPAVQAAVMRFLSEEIGNAGSRTHEFGLRAKKAVMLARRRVAAVVGAQVEEVVFTSGATESNNLALLGLFGYGIEHKRTHIVTTAIEHKAVLEPIAHLESRGFSVTKVAPNSGGWVDAADVAAAVRPETLAVSVMHVNNETGVIQPIREIAEHLMDHPALFHVDAAQGFGKLLPDLRHPRIDLISVSAHKIYGPKGIGALVIRRRGLNSPPLRPLCYGGGQERGLRPGTLPVPLVAGFGEACSLAIDHSDERISANQRFKKELLQALSPLDFCVNGDLERTVAHTLNVSFDGIDSEAAMVALKSLVAVSNGSACTSQSYEPSHVLTAMRLPRDRVQGAIRFSWCHLTETPDWQVLAIRLKSLA